MIDYIKKSLIVHKKSLWMYPLLSMVLFAIGHAILWCVMLLVNDKDLTSFEFGTFLTLIASFYMGVFGTASYRNSFNYALSMSQKRINIITGLTIVSVLKYTFMIITIVLLNTFERFVCNTVFKEYALESSLYKFFTIKNLLLIILVFVAVESLFGSLFTKFGMKCFWILWIFFVILIPMSSKFIHKLLDDNQQLLDKIVEFFTKTNINVLYCIAVFILLLLIALPYAILKKQRVTI